MSTNVEDGAAKSKKTAVKVGSEFGGIAGILVLGGVVAVGIAAGAIAYVRKRQANCNRTRLHKDENQCEETVQISCKNSGEICSHPNPNEYFGRKEAELTEPSSENTEETEPIVEIVESLSDLDISPDWKDMSKSKEEDSPRSHFSRKTSITSVSSDSEDLSEISKNNYIRDSEIDSSRMNLKEGNFYFTPIEETAGKEASSHLRDFVPDNEECISSVKQSMDLNFEYEESVDSCDGLEEECEEVGKFVELGGSVAEQVGEQKLAVFNGWEGITQSGQCNLDCTETYSTMMGTVIDNGNREHNKVGLEEDGGSLCIEQVHVTLKNHEECITSVEQSMDLKVEYEVSVDSCDGLEEECEEVGRFVELGGSVAEQVGEQKLAVFDGCEGIKESGQCNLDCTQTYGAVMGTVIDSGNREHNRVSLEEDGESLCVEQVHVTLKGINAEVSEDLQRKDVAYEEIGSMQISETLNEDICLEKKESQLQNVDSEQDITLFKKEHLEENIGSSEGLNCHEEEHSQDVIDLKNSEDYTGGVGCFGKANTRELKEEKLCPVEELSQWEAYPSKEFDCTEIDVHVHQDGYQNGMIGANGELLLCNEQCLQEEKFVSNVEQCLQEEKFESNVEQCLQERISSEEDLEDCMIDETHKGKQCQYGIVDSRDFEDLDYKGDASHCDENGQHGELEESEEIFCHTPNKEESRKEPVTFKELEGEELDVHDHQDGPQNDIVGANEEMILCKEQCLQEEKLELNVEQCSQERTDSEELEDFKDNVAHKGEPYQCETVDSSYFEGLDCMADKVNKGEQCQYQTVDSSDFEDLDYKGGASHSDENGQHGKLEEPDEKKNDTPIKEEIQQEPDAFKEMEGTEIYVHDHQDGPQNDIISANEEMLLCKEQCLQEENFELNVEHFSQERTDSEESEVCKDNVAHKGEPYQCGTDDSSYLEGLDYKGGVYHSDEGQHEELEELKEHFYAIKQQSSSETNQSKEMECAEADVHVDQDEQNEIVFNEQYVQEEECESNVDLCLQERTESEELEDSKVDAAHKGEQYHDETVDSRHLGTTSHHDEIDRHRELEDSEENLSPIKKQCQNKTARYKDLECANIDLHVHQDGHENEIVVSDEEPLLCKEQCLQEEKFESNIEQHLQERTDSEEELENCVVDLANNGEQCQYGTVNSRDFGSSDYNEGVSYWDGKGQKEKVEESEEKFVPIKEQIQQETIKEMECTVDNVHVHQDEQQNFVIDANEKVLPCKEQYPQEEKFEYNVENYPQERTESEEFENCKINEAHNGEQYQYEAIDSKDIEILDYKECERHCDENCQDKETVDSEEHFCPSKEQFQEETVKNGHQNQIVAAYEQVLLSKEQSLNEETFKSHSEQSQQETAGSEELENCKVDVAHKGKQCQFDAIDSREFVALGEGASHENGSCQYGAVNSKDFESFDEGASHKNGSCQYGAVRLSEFGDSKGGVPFGKEQSEKVRAEAMEDVDQHISSENNFHLREENPKQSPETIEDVSDMDVQCGESTIDLNGKDDKEGVAHIFEEEYQEELLDSIDSQTFVQDAHVESEGCEEIISKSEEVDLTEEVVPIIQEYFQEETADSIDKQDSVEDLSLKNKQYQRKMGESEVFNNLHISGEECKENTIDLEKLEPSENVHFSNERGQQDIVDPGETIGLENVNQYKQCQRVDVNGKELEYSIDNALILKGLCPNEIVDLKDPDNEDPQTKPKEFDDNKSEYPSGDALGFKEKYQQEVIDKAATEDYKQDPENFPELEGVHTNNSENSSTHTHCLNDKKEVKQDMSTTIVSESCKLVGVSKESQVHNESTDSETDSTMESESRAVATPYSVTKRLKNVFDPLHSPQLSSRAEEGKFHLIQFPRHLTIRIRTTVCLLALFAFLFLFASKLAKVSTSGYAT